MARVIEHEVIVVGAGPGGSTCASYLAKEGIDVLLIDRETFPREKPCGDGMDYASVFHLTEIGCVDEYLSNAWPCKGFEFTSPDGTKARLEDEVHTCPRRISDNIIRQHAERLGATVFEDCWVYDVIKEEGQIRGVRAKYQGEYIELRAKVVIGADGAHSLVAKSNDMYYDGDHISVVMRGYMSGVELIDYWEFFFDDFVTPGYLWLMPYERHEKGFVNIGLGIARPRYKTESLEQLCMNWLENSENAHRFKSAKWVRPLQGWRIPHNLTQDNIYDDGMILIGDAAGQNFPVSGEGVSPAMTAGRFACMTIKEALKHNDFSKEGLTQYSALVKQYMVPCYKAFYDMAMRNTSVNGINGFMYNLKHDPKENEIAIRLFTSKDIITAFV